MPKNSKVKFPRRNSKAAGFDKVPSDEADTLNEWHGIHLPPLAVPPNQFEACVTATDAPPDLRSLGPSICAWQIREKGDAVLLPPERWAGRPVESDESKGYVAAVAGVLDRVPVASKVMIYCRNEWIVNAINGDMYKWDEKGELSGKRKYWRIWIHILSRCREISADPSHIEAARPNADDDKIIEQLKEWARGARPQTKGRS